MRVRSYTFNDTEAIIKLFHDTVHEVNIRDYTPEQVAAWAPANIDTETWLKRTSNKFIYSLSRSYEVQ